VHDTRCHSPGYKSDYAFLSDTYRLGIFSVLSSSCKAHTYVHASSILVSNWPNLVELGMDIMLLKTASFQLAAKK
jgi:hypothetical protein